MEIRIYDKEKTPQTTGYNMRIFVHLNEHFNV